MPDLIKREFVMYPVSIPPNQKIVDPLAQPSDKGTEQNPSVPSLDCMVGDLFC